MKWVALFCLGQLLLLKSHTVFDHNDLYKEIGKTEADLSLPVLHQPFTYLGQGAQVIVFGSADGVYVLKIFKGSHKTRFKFSRIWGQLVHKKAAREEWRSKFTDTCRRYEMAFDHLKDETGLVLLHFQQTASPLPVTLIDKTAYRLDISTLPFILQKRAVLAPDYFRSNPEKKQLATQALKDFFVRRIEKGFSDPRQTLTINYGFIEDTPVQIDVGKIEPFRGDREEELKKIHARIDLWVSKL
ncbi:MAG: hypothetical protein JSS30_03160 [Verrucomicrobia bacterium]|nr:hypothetical protein [Verrucomicrobiota bacterium]